jgi:hypothetical protein
VQAAAFGDISIGKHRMFDMVFQEDGTLRQLDEQYL